ncbi:M17 family peptidase N-terminal domain-containing protein, partial [Kaarinaea lacus]
MELSVKTTSPASQHSACLVVGVFEKRKLSSAASEIDAATKGYITRIMKQGDMEGKAGQTLMLFNLDGISAERVLLVGCGKDKSFSTREFKKANQDAFKALNDSAAKDAVSYLSDLSVRDRSPAEVVRLAAETALYCEYRFSTTKSADANNTSRLKNLCFNVAEKNRLKNTRLALDIARAIARGRNIARELGNLPGNICTPSYLASEAQKNARQVNGMKVRILKETELEKLGMG